MGARKMEVKYDEQMDGATNKVAVLGVGWLVSHYTIWHLVQCVSAMLVMITC